MSVGFTQTPSRRENEHVASQRRPCAPGEATFLTLDQWQAFVESHPQSIVFHHRRWIELILQQYGGKCIIPAVRRDGRIATAVPLIETRSPSGKRRLTSLPFSDCVPVLSDAADPTVDVRECMDLVRDRQYGSVVIRSDRPLGDAPAGDGGVRHVLGLRAYAEISDAYDAKLRSNLRRNRRRAEENQVVLHDRTDADAMEAFYRLHVMTRRRLGVPVQSKRFFERLQTMILAGGLGHIAVVEKDARAIGAAVFLVFNQTVIYKYSAADPAAVEHRPTELILEDAIRTAAEAGRHFFDFGGTAKSNEGLRWFKCKWGAVESNAYQVYFQGEPRPRPEDSRLVRLTSRVIQRSPPVVCRLLGEAFYRFSQ